MLNFKILTISGKTVIRTMLRKKIKRTLGKVGLYALRIKGSK